MASNTSLSVTLRLSDDESSPKESSEGELKRRASSVKKVRYLAEPSRLCLKQVEEALSFRLT